MDEQIQVLALGIDSRSAVVGAAQWDTAVRQVQAGASASDRAIGVLTGRLDAAARTFKAAAASVGSLVAGFVSVQAIQAATRTIADFETSLASIRGATDATAETMERLADAAKRVSSTSTFSPGQAAESLLVLSRAGFDATQAIDALQASLNLAQGAQVTAAQSGQLLVQVISQFGFTAKDAGYAADILVKSANESVTGAIEIGSALAYAGTVAKLAGVSFKEASAAVGVLANNGIDASSAGTNLRGVILSLLNPTSEAKDAFKSLGLSVDDVNVRARGIVPVLASLRRAGANVQDLENIFGRLNVAGGSTLIANLDQFEAFISKLDDSAGASQRLANTMGNTLSGVLAKARNEFAAIVIAIGEAGYLKAVTNAITFTTDFLSALTGVGLAGRQVSNSAKLAAEAITAAAVAATAFVATNLAIELGLITTSFTAAAGAAGTFVLALATNPVVWIAAAAAALYIFRDRMIEVGDETATVGDLLAATFGYVVDVVRVSVQSFSQYWREGVSFIAESWSDLVTVIRVDWQGAIDFVLGILRDFANKAIAVVKSIGDTYGVIFGRLYSAVTAIGNVDFADPIKSAQDLGVALSTALSPTNTGADIANSFRENFGRDFVGEMIPVAAKAGETIGTAITDGVRDQLRGLSIEDFPVLDAVAGLGNPYDEIRRRAAARRKAREGDELINATEGGLYPGVVVPGSGKKAADEVGYVQRAFTQLSEEAKKAQKNINDLFRDLENDVSNAKLPNDELRAAKLVQQYRAEAAIAGLSPEQQAQDTARIRALEKEIRLWERARNASEQFGDLASSSVEDVALSIKSASQALEDFVRDLQKMLFRQLVTQPLSQAIASGTQGLFASLFSIGTSAGVGAVGAGAGGGSGVEGSTLPYGGRGGAISAMGNVFDRGRLIPFAMGGMIDRGRVYDTPTVAPMSLFGESGPEAIFPLTRGASGELGVRAAGGAASTTNNSVTFGNVIINVPESASKNPMNYSGRQLAGNVRRAMG